MNYLTRTMVVVAITFGFSSAVTAASVNIPDSTFDGTTSELGNGGWTPSNGAPLSWSVTPSDGSQSGIYNPIDYEYFPADIDNITNVGYANNGYLSQTLPEALTASIIYTLTVDVGNTSGHSFPGFKIQLWAKGATPAMLAEFVGAADSIPDGEFAARLVEFKALADNPNIGDPLEIRLVGLGLQIHFDNVTLVTDPVVETYLEVPDSTFDDVVASNWRDGSWTPRDGYPETWAVTPIDGPQSGIFNPQSVGYLPTGEDNISNVGYVNNGSLSQILTDKVKGMTRYTLSVDVGNTRAHPFPGFNIQLWAHGDIPTMVAEFNGAADSVPEGEFMTRSAVFDASAGDASIGDPLEIRLVGLGLQIHFDNVTLKEEPIIETFLNVPDSTFDGTSTVLEDGDWWPLQCDGCSLDTWSVTPSGGANSGIYNPPSSSYFLNASNVGYANAEGSLSQMLASTVAGFTKYTLSVDVGNALGADFPGFKIQLWANGASPAMLAEFVGAADSVFEGEFATRSVVFETAGNHPNIGDPLEIRLVGLGFQTHFDNVSLKAETSSDSLVKSDFLSPGDGLLVTDTETGIVWLSPEFTLNRSYNDIVNGIDELLTTHRFQFAPSEIVRLMINRNFNNPTSVYPGNAAGFSSAGQFMNIFKGKEGYFYCGALPCPRSQALSVDGNILTGLGMIQFGSNGYMIDWSSTVASIGGNHDTQRGVWLIRGASVPGTNVDVTPTVTNDIDIDIGDTKISFTFDEITASGETTVTVSHPVDGPMQPSGLKLGNPPVYFDLATTATFEESVEVCFNYDAFTFGAENTLIIAHYEKGQWIDVTTSLNLEANQICGVVESFSPFALFEPEDPVVLLEGLWLLIEELNAKKGIVNSLDAKFQSTKEAFEGASERNEGAAVNALQALINATQAQSGKHIEPSEANELIGAAQEIITVLTGEHF